MIPESFRFWEPREHKPPEPHEEAEREQIAARQLDRAELYIVAAINLELADPDIQLALHRLRVDLLAVIDKLGQPRLL